MKKDPSKTTRLISEFEEEKDDDGSISLQDTPSQALLRIYLEKQDVHDNTTVHFSTYEDFLRSFITFILRLAIYGEPFSEQPGHINFKNVTEVTFDDYFELMPNRNVLLSETVQPTKEKAEEILEEASSKSESIGSESRADWCISHKTYDIGNRKEFERFKKFIKGTLGERYLWLWMDIERLKVLKDAGRHQRHLEKMKKCYLVSSGDCYLSAEILTKFKLLDGSQWNKEHLKNIQTEVIKPLLLYWAPRFCVTHSCSIKHASAELKLWHLRQEKPRKDVDPFPQMATLLPLRPKSCIPQISDTKVKTMADDDLGGYDMENLLQSLYVENRAGFFFTKFCEHSENKYLFATYVAPSATLDIGLQQEKKKEIYMKIQPPFEDLFDTAEEYILLLLLEPWTKMVKSDQVTYRQVELVEETRQLDSTYFRKLQALHKETFSKKPEDATYEIGTVISPLPDVSKQTEYWNNVPEEYRNFNFNNLLSNKLEFEHFRQFLEAHNSSMDLMCWIDIEQFRRIIHKDRKQREEKSRYIKNKYLNKKYFFGPNSPASLHQQDQIMNLSGGWGKILHEQLDAPILIEIQKHVLNRLENVWLPLFLASKQFAERQKIKVQMKDIAEELLLQKHERKIGVWKASDICYILPPPVESKWISSSCEIIAFRKALLNPVTARQFQRFVALKGDLLENGVLFWQEVQKYKDLCHSHCDESIIHKKVMTIINCFINSSIPPALQIDIPLEQAQKIIEHRKELGPYVFREAQIKVLKSDDDCLELLTPVASAMLPRDCSARTQGLVLLGAWHPWNIRGAWHTRDMDGVKQYTSTSGTSIKTPVLSNGPVLGLQAYGRQPTWCYSKYIEALEQERVLLKIQEDLEKKLFAGTPSFTNVRPTASGMSLKKTVSSHASRVSLL
ncbi:Regulator of G-protein signaling 22 [Pteropus alecto]|uniref:Regulator of G-protein signaling 22 n=1 Tax=Pteropus alecto TaxID=9402 RepID=L5KBA4_PTEAL|nr:Regulator of G-protein signaling 22 [Pteropus alecto]